MTSKNHLIYFILLCVFVGSAYLQRQRSLHEKRRVKLKGLLHDYVEQKERQFRQANTPTVVCNDDLPLIGQCDVANGKDLYISNMFEAYKFRLNQIENNDQRFNRISKWWKVTANKGLKKDEFTNSSLWLEAVVGGNVSNPVCNDVNVAGTALGLDIQAIFSVLSQCPESIGSTCIVDYITAELTPEILESCDSTNTVLKEKINDCRDNEAYNIETRCPCLIEAVDAIDDFKKTKYDIETVNGNVKKNCIVALLDTQKLARTQYETCVASLIACKQNEDAAIAVINNCNNADSSTVDAVKIAKIVSSHRSFSDDEINDEIDEIMEDFEEIDYDY